jgi:CRISPR-associated protein Cmr3
VVLTTPASFSEGSVPKQLSGARVVAACVGRPEVVSGWDFEKNRPKPARRVCPAGSVFWVEPEGDVQDYVNRVWLQSVCTDEQDQRDGYGIALVGVA